MRDGVWYIPGVTWAQTVTIVAPILVAIIGGLFYGNRQFELIGRRISDLQTSLRGEIGDLRTDMNARFSSVDARFSSVDSRFATFDSRFAAIDSRFATMETLMEARFAETHQELRELRGLLHHALGPRAS